MVRRTTIGKTPREHFMLALDEEFAKFERQERSFQNADRKERAERLRLPVKGQREAGSSSIRASVARPRSDLQSIDILRRGPISGVMSAASQAPAKGSRSAKCAPRT